MTYEIRDGWIHGEIPGPEGRLYKVEHHPITPTRGPLSSPVHPYFHETQGFTVNGAVSTLRSRRIPVHFVTGEHRVAQCLSLKLQSDGSVNCDAHGIQIE